MINHTLVDIDDAQHLIIYTIRKLISNEKVEKKLLKQFTADFDKILNEIKNTYNEEPITSLNFKYDNSKVYLIEDHIAVESYKTNKQSSESEEQQIERLKTLLDCLLNDLSSLLYEYGYKLIFRKLNEFRSEGDLKFIFIPVYFNLGKKYGKNLHNGLIILHSYKKLLVNYKDFNFDEWDKERALQAYQDSRDALLLKYGEAYKSDTNAMRFFDEYFKLSIKLTKNACNELLKMIKDNNIKFN
jgi:hypothetical protein